MVMKIITALVTLIAIYTTAIVINLYLLTSGPYLRIISLYRLTPPTLVPQAFTLAQAVNYSAGTVRTTARLLCHSIEFCLTASEISHLEDVARLIQLIKIVWMVSIVLAASLLYLTKSPTRAKLNHASQRSIFITLILLAAAWMAWPLVFQNFHRLLFSQGNWSFSPTSLIISLYPEGFWSTAAIIFLILTLIELVTLFKYTKPSP